MQNPNRKRQRGFALPETVIAALCFAVSLLGLLQYHQLQQQAFVHQAQQRQAWRLAYAQLSIYAAGERENASTLAGRDLPLGWQLAVAPLFYEGSCRQVKATAITPQGYQAQLLRWFC